MIGGHTAFGSGGWDKTILEKVIPVDMDGFDRGSVWSTIYPTIPKESLTHPIWQIAKTPEESVEIIKQHPRFNGTNIVNRAKPGATVLAYWKNRNNMPLICVQSYGKGRSMAFTSDAAGDWGKGYEEAWGPNRRNNQYYQKFWVNAIMWLGENSLRNKQNKMRISTDKLNYFMNNEVELSVVMNEKNLEYNVEAKLSQYNNKIKLKSLGSGKYVGKWTVPKNYLKNTASLVVNAVSSKTNNSLTDSVRINIIPANTEFINSDPDFELLKKMMVMTGGRNLKTSKELEDLLKGTNKTLSSKVQKAKIPIWDNWILWLIILLLWTAEWVIRKWG